jgi:transcriptional regulator with XRE-family HTH domain
MDIGKKIKRLRTEKLMTQAELTGKEITRNMLSRIENGAALPSIGTVVYLASKLGVPAGYLLSEGEEEFIYHKSSVMKNVRRAYTDKNFELCRDICLTEFEEYDDELELILTDCCLGVAEECLKIGQLHRACEFLDEAVIHSRLTMFDTTTQTNGIVIIFCLLKSISPALDSDEIDTDINEDTYHPAAFGTVLGKYITVLQNCQKYSLFESDIDALDKEKLSDQDKLFILHAKARWLIENEEFGAALKVLKEVIDSETVPERLLLYLACADMEICCRETGDYKGAYEYSINKIEILEHMLAED